MNVTIADLIAGVIYTGTLTAALTGIGAFMHFAVVRPMRSFLRKEIVGSLTDIKDAVNNSTQTINDLDARLTQHITNGGHMHTADDQQH